MDRFSILVALGLACNAPLAGAQAEMADSALREALERIELPQASSIDLAHGRDVVMGKAQCLTTNCMPCFQCHQVQGEGSVSIDVPRIAGQPFRYLYNSLRDFASGRRFSPVMTPIARAWPPEAWRDVAAFYSLQKVEVPDMAAYAAHLAKPDFEKLAHGAKVANVGLPERGVQGCVNCHGPQGAGLPPVYPYLAGQYSEYLQQRLKAWKTGAVAPGGYGFGIMEEIAQRLTDEDIEAVSLYFASIRPPRIVRDENYSGPLELGVPLGRQRGLRGEPLPRRAP